MTNKYIYIGMGVIVLILLCLYIGKSIGQKDQKDIQIKDRIKIVQVDNKKQQSIIDSLNNIVKTTANKTQIIKEKEIIIREKANDIIITKPENTTECDELYENSVKKITLLEETISYKDTIESNLKYTIDNQQGIILSKDKIIANKDLEIKLTKELSKPRIKKYSIGIQVGYGVSVVKTGQSSINFKTTPYIGLGISRNILSF